MTTTEEISDFWYFEYKLHASGINMQEANSRRGWNRVATQDRGCLDCGLGLSFRSVTLLINISYSSEMSE